MIKIMHICSDTNIGGAGRYLLNLLKNSNKSKYKLYFCLPRGSQLKKILQEANGKVIEVDIVPDKSFNIKDVFKIRKVLKKYKPDIVHTHASFSGRVASKASNIGKIIYTRHYVDVNYNKKGLPILRLKSKVKGIINNLTCDGVIGVVGECVQVLTNMGVDKKKIKIIYNGVNPIPEYSKEQKDEVKKKYNIGPDDKVISIIGRISKEKGHEVFIESIRILSVKRSDIKAIMAGTGIEESSIKYLIKKNKLEDNIAFIGFVDNITDILNITDVQLNTSYTEAQSLALLEGMSAGIPAVASNIGGNPKVIRHGKNGFVVPVEDSRAFVKRTCEILDNSDLYNYMKQNAKKIYNKRFTASRMTRQTENFYDKILKGRV
ncbi:hypothetical protein AN640_02905 [Candidatus Epulonipiscium fishelsonii]|uniref:Uncharacterized protein n=1 Tax=Candidatus Epulonipiscium fishelsonii TaxID=77094 RepID=A0ACC8X823_9FIRM|nr:hypothetical protein AN640_02905 [Epulopiscium sp. SCG-D08WGA-EpuloA1]OON90530.1 MAG: hypothetical protein ATN32_03725 [Epulopiscium sp. AS2M-Bin002]